MKAAGSKGPFDLVAVRKDGARFIQVKRCKDGNGIRREDLQALEAVSVPPGTTKEL